MVWFIGIRSVVTCGICVIVVVFFIFRKHDEEVDMEWIYWDRFHWMMGRISYQGLAHKSIINWNVILIGGHYWLGTKDHGIIVEMIVGQGLASVEEFMDVSVGSGFGKAGCVLEQLPFLSCLRTSHGSHEN